MRRRLFIPATGVSNFELFYDLIFVYLIRVITGVMHHPEGGFFDPHLYALYAIDMLTVLQTWFFTTFLHNRYGDGGALDNVCLFINMFLLYFMASSVDIQWQGNMMTWNLAWAFILIDLAVHWLIKRTQYTNLDDDDRAIMNHTIIVLIVQAIIVLVAAFVPWTIGQWFSIAAFAFGWLSFAQGGRLTRKPERFDHLAERCSLLVIVTFGETVIGIGGYAIDFRQVLLPILGFAVIIGLFLNYFLEHDRMLNHHGNKHGVRYLLITAGLVFIIDNITIALEYLPEEEIRRTPEVTYFCICIAAYLLATLAMKSYAQSAFPLTTPLVVGRIIAVLALIVVSILFVHHTAVLLACTTAIVWGVLLQRYMIYRRQRAFTDIPQYQVEQNLLFDHHED